MPKHSTDAVPAPPAPSAPPIGEAVGTRPSRAELRRQREAGTVPERAARPAATAPTSRAEQRRLSEQERRGVRRERALWKAWWLYPLLVLIALFVFLGVRSASTPVPDGPQWVVTSNSPESSTGSPGSG